MMAMMAIRARAEIVARGTIGVSKRDSVCAKSAAGEFGFSPAAILASVVDMQTALVQHEAARVDLVHERDVVGGDDHGSARFVELDE